MKKLLLLLLPTLALAQSVPNGGVITLGQVWTPAQWNTAWQSKVDYPCVGCGGTSIVGPLKGNGTTFQAASASDIALLFCASSSTMVLMANGTCSAGTPIPSLPSYVTPLTNDYLIVYSQTDSQAEKATIRQVIESSLSIATGTSLTPNCVYSINNTTNTQSVGTLTVNAPTGCTAVEGQSLKIHIKSTNVQTYSWNAAFVGGTTSLPTASSGASKGDWIGFLYDSINAKWDYVAVATGF
jgi:hypothetical protein